MANTGEPGGNPTPGMHPRMSAPPPAGPGGSTTGQLRETAAEVSERLGQAWESTRQGAQAVAQRAQDFWQAAGQLIRRNPMAAVGISFFVGCLVGCCWSAWSVEDDMTERMSRASA